MSATIHLARCALLGCAALLVAAPPARAAQPDERELIPLYQGTAPGSEGWSQREGRMEMSDPRFPASRDQVVWNVVRPTLTVFRPARGQGNGTAIIVAPGGGFRVLSWLNEGVNVAQWLADRGYTAFVLKYRLHRMPDDPADLRRQFMATLPAAGASAAPVRAPIRIVIGPEEQMAISDGQRAIAVVRRCAPEFGISAERVGIIGFSAGGVVAGTAGIADRDRANFVGIIYSNVAGQIPPHAATAFMAGAADDPLAASMPDLFARWRTSGADAEIHVYAKGQHGFGTRRQGLPVDGWLDAFAAWLDQQGFARPQPAARPGAE
ncbi:MAG: dienelactone hydrolase family protein [Gammaproteobacteria bacterium]|nr:dienelactone hydrolase family protein [Gammaproteobacteria bacterium]